MNFSGTRPHWSQLEEATDIKNLPAKQILSVLGALVAWAGSATAA